MVAMISTIFLDEASMSPIVVTTPPTTAPPRVAMSVAEATRALAWLALAAFWRTAPVSSSIARVVRSRLAACDSVRRARSALPLAISVLALAMVSAEPLMPATSVARRSRMSFSATSRLSLSPASIRISIDRSPVATACAIVRA